MLGAGFPPLSENDAGLIGGLPSLDADGNVELRLTEPAHPAHQLACGCRNPRWHMHKGPALPQVVQRRPHGVDRRPVRRTPRTDKRQPRRSIRRINRRVQGVCSTARQRKRPGPLALRLGGSAPRDRIYRRTITGTMSSGPARSTCGRHDRREKEASWAS